MSFEMYLSNIYQLQLSYMYYLYVYLNNINIDDKKSKSGRTVCEYNLELE